MTNLLSVKTKLLLSMSMLLVSQQAVADSDAHSIGLLFGGLTKEDTNVKVKVNAYSQLKQKGYVGSGED